MPDTKINLDGWKISIVEFPVLVLPPTGWTTYRDVERWMVFSINGRAVKTNEITMRGVGSCFRVGIN